MQSVYKFVDVSELGTRKKYSLKKLTKKKNRKT